MRNTDSDKGSIYCPACDGEGGDQRTGSTCFTCAGRGEVSDDDDAYLAHLESRDERRMERAEYLEDR